VTSTLHALRSSVRRAESLHKRTHTALSWSAVSQLSKALKIIALSFIISFSFCMRLGLYLVKRGVVTFGHVTKVAITRPFDSPWPKTVYCMQLNFTVHIFYRTGLIADRSFTLREGILRFFAF